MSEHCPWFAGAWFRPGYCVTCGNDDEFCPDAQVSEGDGDE